MTIFGTKFSFPLVPSSTNLLLVFLEPILNPQHGRHTEEQLVLEYPAVTPMLLGWPHFLTVHSICSSQVSMNVTKYMGYINLQSAKVH